MKKTLTSVVSSFARVKGWSKKEVNSPQGWSQETERQKNYPNKVVTPYMLRHNFRDDRDLIVLPTFLVPQPEGDQPTYLPPPRASSPQPPYLCFSQEGVLCPRQGSNCWNDWMLGKVELWEDAPWRPLHQSPKPDSWPPELRLCGL